MKTFGASTRIVRQRAWAPQTFQLEHLKKELDTRFGCSWHVVTGEEFGFDIDFEAEKMMYIFYGSLAVLLWKCGSQLLKEVRYKNAAEEEELKKKERLTKGTKYSKVFY